jgi:hypothetical protein
MLRFIHRFLTEEAFRRKVLYRENEAMTAEGLLPEQQTALMSFLPQDILNRLLADLPAAEQALKDRLDDKMNDPGPAPMMAPADATAMNMNLMYGEGTVHIRGITPPVVSPRGLHTFRLRGQGFGPTDEDIEVEFTHVTQETKTAHVIGTTCDADILQRVTVEVDLQLTGEWSVRARSGLNDWSTDVVTINVNA